MVSKLNKNGESVACGFHSNNPSQPNLYKTGKDILYIKDRYSVFIHSDMLTEGLDFCELDIVIFIDTFKNTKSFIQQVGRAMRNSSGKTKTIVYVPKDEKEYWTFQWNMYIKFDKESTDLHIQYIDGCFAERFILSDEFYKDISLPRRAQIYLLGNETLENISDSITKKLKIRLT